MHRICCGIACSLIVLGLFQLRHSPATAQDKKPSGPSIVWLVRHAEKADNSTDALLKKPEGEQRAEDLAKCLDGKGVTAIITSNLKRTVQTAAPLVRELNKKSKVEAKQVHLDPSKVKQHIDAVVKEVRATPDTTLVVGHSNTVSRIIQGLGGPAVGEVEEFHRLFRVDLSASKVGFEEMAYGVVPKQSKKKRC